MREEEGDALLHRPGEPDFPVGGGQMGARIRAYGWASTGLGPIPAWPRSLRTAVDIVLNSPVPMVMLWGPDGIMLYNDAYSGFAGGRHPRLLGSKVLEGWPEVADFNARVMHHGLRGETLSFRDQHLVLHRHGRPEDVWMDLDYSPIRDESGAPAGVLAIVVETTERVRAEQQRQLADRALRESEERLRLVQSAGGIGSFDWDLKTGRIHRSPEYLAVQGLPADTPDDGSYSDAWLDRVHPDDRLRVEAWFRADIARIGPFERDYRIIRPDNGETRWIHNRGRVESDAEGKPARLISAQTDVTQLRQAEAALREHEEFLHRILQSSSDCIKVLDLETGLQFMNERGQQILELDDFDAIDGSPWLDFWKGEFAELARNAAEEAKRGGTGRFQGFCPTMKGAPRWWDVAVTPINGANGRPERLLAISRDITEAHMAADLLEQKVQERTAELRNTEEALRQAQKMEAVGQLTGGIAHDFNNLLQGIVGSLDLVRKRVAQGRYDDIDRFLEGAMTSAGKAAALTHRLLAFSRRQPLDPRPVQVNRLIASMEDLLRRTLGASIELDLRFAADLWDTRCDANQLESAVLNLAINARDAMPEGGRLLIETMNTQLDAAAAAQRDGVAPGDYIRIKVTDTGVGMTPEVVSRAFDPFFTTKPLGQGTGLGLSMIYGFVRQSDGYARIESEPGRGTSVYLSLPRYRGAPGERTMPPLVYHVPKTAAGEVIAVVEDEPVVRALILDLLRDLGYQTLEAHDGPSGLDLINSAARIDLLVTDMGLPGLNGRQLASAARQRRSGLKVLFMTGYAEKSVLAGGLDEGMEMITKPFAMDALAQRIRTMIRQDEEKDLAVSR